MIEHLPNYFTIIFVLTTLMALVIFYVALDNSKGCTFNVNAPNIIIGLTFWLILQAFLSFYNIYKDPNHLKIIPPYIALFGTIPTLIAILIFFFTTKGKMFIDSLPLKTLTYLHVVRVPVEVMLYMLFMEKTLPAVMTFIGYNFDVLAGITAPLIAYFAFTKKTLSNKVILIWNYISLALLVNIMILAVLSAPTPLQVLGKEQPNIAILNFPYSWLPTFIAPLVLLSHLIAIRRLKFIDNPVSE
jgi:hypothetical protein